jgi:hypothetical protein
VKVLRLYIHLCKTFPDCRDVMCKISYIFLMMKNGFRVARKISNLHDQPETTVK